MSEMIKCRAPHAKTGGCVVCGGYKYLISKEKVCTQCGLEGWVRPGNYTSYDGKKWNTFDGIRMTDHFGEKPIRLCPKCEAER